MGTVSAQQPVGMPREAGLVKTQQEGQNLRLSSATSPLQINHCFYKALFNSFHADYPAPPQPMEQTGTGSSQTGYPPGNSLCTTYKQ